MWLNRKSAEVNGPIQSAETNAKTCPGSMQMEILSTKG